MSLRTLQWNIGGGLIRKEDADPTNPLSYIIEGLQEIIYTVKLHNPDIITLQEVHSDANFDQAYQIAQALDMPTVVSDVYTDSHLQERKKLGQAILARFPLVDHHFQQFYNPRMQTTGPKGEQWDSADKGVSTATVSIEELQLTIKTCHSFPFRRYTVEPSDPAMKPLFDDMDKKLSSSVPLFLLQGDLNLDEQSVRLYFPTLFHNGLYEVLLDEPTTPKLRRYDHVLYRGFRLANALVDTSVLTDHFPVVCEFELE